MLRGDDDGADADEKVRLMLPLAESAQVFSVLSCVGAPRDKVVENLSSA